MLPVHLAASLVSEGKLWRLPPHDNPPTTETWLISHPGSPLNPAEAAFLEACRSVPSVDHF